MNHGKAGPKRARSRANAASADEASKLGRLIDCLIVRLTMNGGDRRVVAEMLGLDPSVIPRRLKRIPPDRRRRYETRTLAELANIPPDWKGGRLPRFFFA